MGKKFTKGNAGKPKGAENKTTKAAKELFVSIMEGQVENIEASLETIRKKDPGRYLEVLSKFFPYFIPKKLEIDTPTELIVNVKRRS
jgi:hypothetical protein